jgi:membrane-associated phospholipid phosphatase
MVNGHHSPGRASGALKVVGLAIGLFVVVYVVFVGTRVGRALDAAAVRDDLTGRWDDRVDLLVAAVNPLSVVIAVAVLFWLALRDDRPWDGSRGAALVAVSVLLADRLKAALGDLDPLAGEGARELGPAFYPSGHATAVMSICLAALLVLWPRGRLPLALATAALSSLVGFAIYAGGSHHPSDVLGGFLVSLTVASTLVVGRSASASVLPERRLSSVWIVAAPGALGVLALALEGATGLGISVGPLEPSLVMAGAAICGTAFAVVFGFDQVLRGAAIAGLQVRREAAEGQ